MTEEQKLIAELGKPRLGERHVIRVRIRESKEFKVFKSLLFFLKIIRFIFQECG